MERVYITKGEALSMGQELADMRQTPKGEARVFDGASYNGRVTFDRHPDLSGAPVRGGGVALSQKAVIPTAIDPTMVNIGGMQVKREVAVRNGWIGAQEGQHPGPFAANAEPQQQQQQQPEEQQQDTPLEAAGNAALGELAAGFQGDAFAVAIEAAESGDYAAIAEAHGFDQAKISAVVAGATAKADRVIADTGINTAVMSVVLSGPELAEARIAAVQGDDSRLKHVAMTAVNKLASFPERDPAGFKAFWNAHLSDIESDTGPGGQLLVSVEGYGMVPWASAVRMGAVKIG